MIATTLGQQGFELLEDGLDEVRWECGHGFSPSSGSLEDSPDDRASRVRFPSSGPSHLSAQALTVPVFYLPILGHAPEPLLDRVAGLAKNIGDLARTQEFTSLHQYTNDILALLADAVLLGVADYRPASRLSVPLQGELGRLLDVPAVYVQHGIGLAPVALEDQHTVHPAC